MFENGSPEFAPAVRDQKAECGGKTREIGIKVILSSCLACENNLE